MASLLKSIAGARRIILITTIVNFGSLLSGLDVAFGGTAIVLPSFQTYFGVKGQPKKIAALSSNVVSLLFAGAFVGAFITSVTSNRLGRRSGFVWGCACLVIGTALQTSSRNAGWLYAGRFIGGLGYGANAQLAPMYIGECASKAHRARAVAVFPNASATGACILLWIGYSVSRSFPDKTSSWQWRLLAATQFIPGIFFIIGLLFIPESPRYLAYRQVLEERKGSGPLRTRFVEDGEQSDLPIKDKESAEGSDVPSPIPVLTSRGTSGATGYQPYYHTFAARLVGIFSPSQPEEFYASRAYSTLAYIRMLPLSDPSLKEEMAEIFAQIDEVEDAKEDGRAAWRTMVKQPSIRRRLLVTCFLGFWAMWTGTGMLLAYAPTIFGSFGFSSPSAGLLAGGVLQTVKVACYWGSFLFTVNRFGRRITLTAGGIFLGTLYLIVGVLSATKDGPQTKTTAASWAMMAMLYLFAIVYSFTLGPPIWIYVCEIFPVHLRDAGQVLFTMTLWANNFVVLKIAPIAFVNIAWRLWLILAAINIVAGITVWFICPETKGRSIEEMDIVFGAISEEERATHVQHVLEQQKRRPFKAFDPV